MRSGTGRGWLRANRRRSGICLMPDVFVIGGLNGAGKTTVARGMLPWDEGANAGPLLDILSRSARR